MKGNNVCNSDDPSHTSREFGTYNAPPEEQLSQGIENVLLERKATIRSIIRDT